MALLQNLLYVQFNANWKDARVPGVYPLLVSVHSEQTCMGKQAITSLIWGYFGHCYIEFSMKSAAKS